jgi:O-antigen/teichoic acid export membrane protein
VLKYKASITLGSQLIIQVLGFFASFFVARFMGPEPLGVLTAALAYVNIFGILGGLGFGLAHYKRVSEGMDLGKCIGTFFIIRLILTLFMYCVTIASYFGIYKMTGKYPLNSAYTYFFLIIATSFAISNFAISIQNTFSARLEVTKDVIVLIVQKIVNSGFKILIAIGGFSVILLAWNNLLTTLVGLLIALILFRNYPVGKFDKATFKSYLLFAAPITLLQIVEKVSFYIDKVFLSYFIDETEVGFYTIAQSLTNLFLFSSFLFANLLIPTFSKMHAEMKIEEMKFLSRKVFRFISLIISPLMIYMVFFARPIILFIYGSEFEYSVRILQILSFQVLLFFYLQPFSHLITGCDKPYILAKIGIISAVINILLNFILIPERIGNMPLFGLKANGAALALLISVSVRWLMFRWHTYRLFSIKLNKDIAFHLLLATLLNGLLYLLLEFFALNNKLIIISISFIVSNSLYLFILILFRKISKSDFLYYLDLLNVRKIKSSISNELK